VHRASRHLQEIEFNFILTAHFHFPLSTRSQAYTPEGEMYYYHKVSRLARWDKPDSHIVEAMESRMKDLDLASERSIKVSEV